MKIEFDQAKRDATFKHRGIDMGRANEVFEGVTISFADIRFEYGEDRFITFGLLDTRMVVLAWTKRGNVRRIISMRKANEREQRKYGNRMD